MKGNKEAEDKIRRKENFANPRFLLTCWRLRICTAGEFEQHCRRWCFSVPDALSKGFNRNGGLIPSAFGSKLCLNLLEASPKDLE